jgi:hypothetical protein
MEVADLAQFRALEAEVRQLRLAVAGLTETVDRHEHEGRRLGPRPDPSPGLLRLHLDEGVGSGTDNPPRLVPGALVRQLREEGPFKVSPHDRSVIVTDGGRMICAVYNHDERDALVALLNGR